VELRIAAGLSGDEKLCEVFRQGGDVHSSVASRVCGVPAEKVDHEMRRRAKVINFGILYGMGVNALRGNLGADVSRAEATQFLENYFNVYKGLAEYIEHTKLEAARLSYTETLFGRRRYFGGFNSTVPGIRAQAERMAVNAPFQGLGADIIKLAMIQTDALIEKKGWRDRAKLVLQVHDELVYEIKSDEVIMIAGHIRDVMEHVVPLQDLHNVPILADVEAGKNWGDMEKLTREV
jgi:DNA polymerase-1